MKKKITSTIPLIITLFFIDRSFEQESWKSLAGESDDEPSWDAKTAFKGTRDPVFALSEPAVPSPPPCDHCPATTPKPTPPPPPIITFKTCGEEEKFDDDHRNPSSAWSHGWCFLEEISTTCTRYRHGRKLYIADQKATNDITQLLEQWELYAKESNSDLQSITNENIGQWYIEGRDNNGKCRVYNWNTRTTSYVECEQDLRLLCQYPVCRNQKSQSECQRLAKLGDCVKNRAWMEDNCQKTCVCQEKQKGTTLLPNDKVCHRLPFRTTCNNGAKSQFTFRWMLKDGQCCTYPWGYCRGDSVMNEPAIRLKEACECQCLKKC